MASPPPPVFLSCLRLVAGSLHFWRYACSITQEFSARCDLRRAFKQFVDERLIGFGPLRRKSPQLREKPRVDANGNELLGVAASRPANAPRTPELFVRQFRNI